MINEKKYITKETYDNFKRELEELKTAKRPEIAKRLQEAKAQGDLSENAEYLEARESQSYVEGRIQFLESALSNSAIINNDGRCSRFVTIGSKIKISIGGKEQDFDIVGSEEVDPLMNKISKESPMGKAISGLKKGDKTELDTPAGKKEIIIKDIHC